MKTGHAADKAQERSEDQQPLTDALTDFIQWSLDEHKLPPHLIIDKARAALAGARQQRATEQEKVQMLVDALIQISIGTHDYEMVEVANAALAKVKEGK